MATTESFRIRAALLETRAVYRKADAAYQGYGCAASGECCQLAVTRRQPWLWRPEWLILMERVKGVVPPPREDGGCPFLDASGKRCSVYADRPFGCRTFFCGRMTGPRDHPRDAVIALSRRLEKIAQTLDEEEEGPRELLDWGQATRDRLTP